MGVRKLKKLKGDNEVNRHSYCRKKLLPLGLEEQEGMEAVGAQSSEQELH